MEIPHFSNRPTQPDRPSTHVAEISQKRSPIPSNCNAIAAKIFLMLGMAIAAPAAIAATETTAVSERHFDRFLAKVAQAQGGDEALQPGHNKFNEGVAFYQQENYDGALAAFLEARKLYREVDNTQGEAFVLSYIGLVYQGLQRQEDSIAAYEEAIALFREVGDLYGESNTLVYLGSAFLESDPQRALDYYQRSLPLLEQLGNVPQLARANSLIGRISFDRGDRPTAIAAFEQALALYRKLGDVLNESAMFYNLGSVYIGLGDRDRALESYQQALQLVRQTGDPKGEATVRNNIGSVYWRAGRQELALEQYRLAAELYARAGDRFGAAIVRNNIGSVRRQSGAYQEALDIYQEVLAFHRENGNQVEEVSVLNNLASVYQDLGASDTALDYLLQALQIVGGLENPSLEASILSSVAVAYDTVGQQENAIAANERGLAIAREIGDRAQEALLLANLGYIYHQSGDLGKALQLYNAALPLRQATGDRPGEAATLNNIGTVYLSRGDREKARSFYQRSLDLAREIDSPTQEVATLFNLARQARIEKDRPAALEYLEGAIAIVEALRSDLRGKDLRTDFFESVQNYYELYIDTLMQLHREKPDGGYDARALEASERSRARTLLDLLAEAKADVRQGAEPALLDRERELQRQIDALEKQRVAAVEAGGEPAELSALRLQREQLARRADALQAEIRASSPKYAALKYPEPLDVKTIQQQVLDNDTVLLQYALGVDRSYLWVVTRDHIESFELASRSQIEAASRKFRATLTRSLTRRLPQAIAKDAKALGDLILAPAADRLVGKRLLVVGDGALLYAPFAALPIPGEEDYAPLIVEYEVASVPSVSALAAIREETATRSPAPKAIAVLADPIFGGSDDPRTEGSALPDNAVLGQSARDIGLSLPPERLPGTRIEADYILSLLPDDGEILTAFGYDASFASATSPDLSQYRIVHFATHGFVNTQNPALSGLVLSLVDAAGKTRDGFLRLKDIFNLDLPAELVVLSACQTGLGREVRGEGLVGIARGFMYAGTPRLVVSLWIVDDEGTAELMSAFYRKHLQVGLSPTAALRAAQLELWESDRWTSPYYWAGFGFQGDWQVRLK